MHRQILKQIKHQKMSENIVKLNIEQYFLQSKQESNKNLDICIEKSKLYQQNLVDFDIFIQKLNEYDIDPILKKKGVNNLAELLDFKDLETWRMKYKKLFGFNLFKN